jgi:hypothetical protein
MNIDKASYLKLFETKFWSKLNESIVPFNKESLGKEEYLNKLYNQIQDYTYSPSHPRDYIVFNKHNGISRYVPTFTRNDYCVFYLCVKLLENEIATNRVEGTFGGWTLGNPIRLKEEQELLELDYIPFNTINELSWANEWRSFQGIARKYKDIDDFKYFINLDIANFYDTINLSILERNIRHAIPKSKQDVVTLLMHFLHGWNKRLEGYNLKTIGIPQDEIGDISRILANFYLQDYDFKMKEVCASHNARFIRFSDDQIIFAKSKEDARKVLYEASKNLFKINLNINSSKVKEFATKSEFERYWAYEIFDLLQDKENKGNIDWGVKRYFEYKEEGVNFRESSVLKRLLTININLIDQVYKQKLLSIFYKEDVLPNLDLWHFRRIRQLANDDHEFFKKLDDLIPKVLFNAYHYQLLRFYQKDRDGFDTKIILNRINEIKT